MLDVELRSYIIKQVQNRVTPISSAGILADLPRDVHEQGRNIIWQLVVEQVLTQIHIPIRVRFGTDHINLYKMMTI